MKSFGIGPQERRFGNYCVMLRLAFPHLLLTSTGFFSSATAVSSTAAAPTSAARATSPLVGLCCCHHLYQHNIGSEIPNPDRRAVFRKRQPRGARSVQDFGLLFRARSAVGSRVQFGGFDRFDLWVGPTRKVSRVLVTTGGSDYLQWVGTHQNIDVTYLKWGIDEIPQSRAPALP